MVQNGNVSTDNCNKGLATEILAKLSEQRSLGMFCDVQIHDETTKLWAHTCVLASCSPFLLRFFSKRCSASQVEWSFRNPAMLDITSITKCWRGSKNNCMVCMQKIIDFIYTGTIHLIHEHLHHVLNISINLQIESLLIMCQTFKVAPFVILPDQGAQTAKPSHSDHDVETSSVELNATDTKNSCILTNENFGERSDKETTKECTKSILKDKCSAQPHPDKCAKGDPIKLGYSCFLCEKFSLSSNHHLFGIHSLAFHGCISTCHLCSFQDTDLLKIVTHLQNEHENNRLCPLCLFQADTRIHLMKHLDVHKITETEIRPDLNAAFRMKSNSLEEVPEGGDLPNNATKLPDSQVVERLYSNDELTCRRCKFSFQTKETATKHRKIFHNNNRYLCLSCNFNSGIIKTIVAHLRNARHAENTCSICLFETSDINDLNKHLEEHLDLQPFTCSSCSFKFSKRAVWWKHVIAHSNDKIFKCASCDLSFKTSTYLNNHVARVHMARQYKCLECGFKAPYKSFLKRHILSCHKTKNEYVCKEKDCTFKTIFKKKFCIHKNQHFKKNTFHKEKTGQFTCSVCKLNFSLEKNLRRHFHLKHNSGAHRYNCPQCHYSNVRLDKLKEHCYKMHPQDEEILAKIIIPKKIELDKHKMLTLYDIRGQCETSKREHSKISNDVLQPVNDSASSFEFKDIQRNSTDTECSEVRLFNAKLVDNVCQKEIPNNFQNNFNFIKDSSVLPENSRICLSSDDIHVHENQSNFIQEMHGQVSSSVSKLFLQKQNSNSSNGRKCSMGENNYRQAKSFELQTISNTNHSLQTNSNFVKHLDLPEHKQLNKSIKKSSFHQNPQKFKQKKSSDLKRKQHNNNIGRLFQEKIANGLLKGSPEMNDNSLLQANHVILDGAKRDSNEDNNINNNSNSLCRGFSEMCSSSITFPEINQNSFKMDDRDEIATTNSPTKEQVNNNSLLGSLSLLTSLEADSELKSKDSHGCSKQKTENHLGLNNANTVNTVNKEESISISSDNRTKLLTITNFSEGNVTYNEAAGILSLNGINSSLTGAVFLNESTGELSYINLNVERKNEHSVQTFTTVDVSSDQVNLKLNKIKNLSFSSDGVQLDEVTGEIVKVNPENMQQNKQMEEEIIDDMQTLFTEDFFDGFDIENFNEDSFDGFDEFDEMLFNDLTLKSPDQGSTIDVSPRNNSSSDPLIGGNIPRLNEMTGELTFDCESGPTQDIWSEIKPFRDDNENDSLMNSVKNGNFNFLLNEITGEFYK